MTSQPEGAMLAVARHPRPAVLPDAALVAGAVLVGARLLILARDLHAGLGSSDDIPRFFALAHASGRPGFDYAAEYPLLSLVVLDALGRLVHGLDGFAAGVAVMGCAADLGAAWIVARTWGRSAALAYLLIGLPLFELLLTHLDLGAVLCATAGLAAASRGRPRLAGALLAAGFGLKLWPLLLAVVCWRLVGDADRRRLAVSLGASMFLLGAAWLALSGLHGPLDVATYRGASGLQVESIPGSVDRLLTASAPRLELGAVRLGTLPPGVGPLLSVAAVGLAGLVAWRGAVAGRLGAAWVGSVGTLVVAAAVLSPQYAVWLLPGAALAWHEGDRAVAGAVAAALLLTRLESALYASVVAGTGAATAVLLARNLCLVAAVGTAAWAMRRPRTGAP